MLVTILAIFFAEIHYPFTLAFGTNIQKISPSWWFTNFKIRSPTSKKSSWLMTFKSPTSLWPGYLSSPCEVTKLVIQRLLRIFGTKVSFLVINELWFIIYPHFWFGLRSLFETRISLSAWKEIRRKWLTKTNKQLILKINKIFWIKNMQNAHIHRLISAIEIVLKRNDWEWSEPQSGESQFKSHPLFFAMIEFFKNCSRETIRSTLKINVKSKCTTRFTRLEEDEQL